MSSFQSVVGLLTITAMLASLAGNARGQGAAASRTGGLFGRESNEQSEPTTFRARNAAPAAVHTRFDGAAGPVARPVRVRQAAHWSDGAEEIRGEMTVGEAREMSEMPGELYESAEFEVGGMEGDLWGEGQDYHWLDNLWVFGGVQGFKGPVDRGLNGNFGFQEGANYTLPLSYIRSIGLQVGARASQSDLSGSELDESARHQTFFTAGLFRRAEHGWQIGAAFDWLHDEFYTELDVHQVRAEISWISACGNELGVMAASSTADDMAADTDASQFFEVNDQFALFLRVPFAAGGEGRIYGGGTSDRDGIVGGEVSVPINPKWSLQAAAVYLIPEESTSDTTDSQSAHYAEQWGVSINLVWYPGRCPVEGFNPWRPLFNVADNTSLLVDRRE